MKRDINEELVRAQHRYHEDHGYKWITNEIVEEYQKKFRVALQNGENEVDTEMMYRLELKNIYGLTDLEAINILRGYHTRDYIAKYKRIEELIPIVRKKVKELDPEDDKARNISLFRLIFNL